MTRRVGPIKEVFGFFLDAIALIKKNLKLVLVLSVINGITMSLLTIIPDSYSLISFISYWFVFLSLYFAFFKRAQGISEEVKISNIWPLLKVQILIYLYTLWKIFIWSIVPIIIAGGLVSILTVGSPSPIWLTAIVCFAGIPAIFVVVVFRLEVILTDYFVLFHNSTVSTGIASSEVVMRGYKFAVFYLGFLYSLLSMVLLSWIYGLFPIPSLDSMREYIFLLLFVHGTLGFVFLLTVITTLYILWHNKKDLALIEDKEKTTKEVIA